METQDLEGMTKRAYVNSDGTVMALLSETNGKMVTYHLFDIPNGSSFCKASHSREQFLAEYPVSAGLEHFGRVATNSPLQKALLKRGLVMQVNLEYLELT